MFTVQLVYFPDYNNYVCKDRLRMGRTTKQQTRNFEELGEQIQQKHPTCTCLWKSSRFTMAKPWQKDEVFASTIYSPRIESVTM